ncbi:MAG: glycosyltransferase family 2 protein [Nanoarchaeota archaeon]
MPIKDTIMLVSSVLFGILFLFLVFIFLVFIISLFIKKRNKQFEPKLSIVIPAYNEEKNIGECLDSVFDSNYPMKKLEVIVVDDGSTDNSLKIMRKYKKVSVYVQNHLGKVEALNLGALNCSHDFIITIDADTILDKNCIRELIMPLHDKNVGVTTGNNEVRNKTSILAIFQSIEYHITNLLRNSFSNVFKDGVWIAGSLACYRKSAIKRVGFFKKDTLAEDIDIALELKKKGYKAVIVPAAFGQTVVPSKLHDLYKQRVRWWRGVSQAIVKNKELLSLKSTFSIIYLYLSHFWWSIYALLSLPLIIFQIFYWLPYNTQSLFSVVGYFIRWLSLLGPIYVVYKIPDFGLSVYSIFGVLSGIITAALSFIAVIRFKDKITLKNIFAIFFYFPYTIVLNIIILTSLLKHRFWQRSFYLK